MQHEQGTDPVHVDKSFSRGNVWSIIATILSAATVIAYVAIDRTEIKAQARSNASELVSLRNDLAAQRSTVQALQVSNAENGARFEALAQSMNEVKSTLRDMANLLREARERGSP